jgi:hypothetical protein
VQEWYQWSIPLAGAIAAALAYRIPRAGLWMGLMVLSFALSSLWWDYGGPMPAAFGAATNFAIALIMLKYARNKWEFYIVDCYCLMILIDILWQFGTIPSHFWFAISLEAANWAIILLIGAMGIADRLRQNGELRGRGHYDLGLGLLGHHLNKPARYPRWWREAE